VGLSLLGLFNLPVTARKVLGETDPFLFHRAGNGAFPPPPNGQALGGKRLRSFPPPPPFSTTFHTWIKSLFLFRFLEKSHSDTRVSVVSSTRVVPPTAAGALTNLLCSFLELVPDLTAETPSDVSYESS